MSEVTVVIEDWCAVATHRSRRHVVELPKCPTELAIHDPAHVGVAQRLLGHATYRTTEDAYNLASSIEAVRRYQGALAALRAATRSAIRPAPAPANPRPFDR